MIMSYNPWALNKLLENYCISIRIIREESAYSVEWFSHLKSSKILVSKNQLFQRFLFRMNQILDSSNKWTRSQFIVCDPPEIAYYSWHDLYHIYKNAVAWSLDTAANEATRGHTFLIKDFLEERLLEFAKTDCLSVFNNNSKTKFEDIKSFIKYCIDFLNNEGMD